MEAVSFAFMGGVVGKSMKKCLVIDGRNIYDAEEMKGNGFEYYCIGK